MSLPKQGTRKISINGKIFLWCVSTKLDYLSVTIETEEYQLLLFLIPFTDIWLRLGLKPATKENLPKNEIKVITPSFVKEIIKFGLSNDWLLQNKNQPYRVTFTDGEFKKIT